MLQLSGDDRRGRGLGGGLGLAALLFVESGEVGLLLLEGVDGAAPLFAELAELEVRDIVGVVEVDELEDLEGVLLAQLHVEVLEADAELIEGDLAVLRVKPPTEFKSKKRKAWLVWVNLVCTLSQK